MYCLRFLVIVLGFFWMFSENVLAQWIEQDPGIAEDMNVITYSPVDENTIWIAGGRQGDQPVYQVFSKTGDGGETWMTGTVPAGDNFFFSNIFALNNKVAWVTMVDNIAQPHGGRVYKTTDGGKNWVHQETAFGNDLTSSSWHRTPNFIYFWNKNDGVVVGDENNFYFDIYVTSNGGDSWTRVPSSNIPDDLPDEEMIHFNRWIVGDSTMVCGTSRGRIMITRDRGYNWSVSNPGLGDGVVYTGFSDEMNGYATGPTLNKKVAKTTDGGKTWTTMPTELPFHGLITPVEGTDSTLMLTSAGLGWYHGTLDHGYGFSFDGGQTWTIEGNLPLIPCLFVDKKTGWTGSVANNKIYKWTGRSLDRDMRTEKWQAIHAGFPEKVMPAIISIVDENTLWAGGTSTFSTSEPFPDQTISKTNDGGMTWTVTNYPGDSLYTRSLSAIDEHTAWIVADNRDFKGSIFRTIDGGKSWERQSSAFEGYGHGPKFVHFWDAQNGVAIGSATVFNGGYFEIYTTTNGGEEWIRTPLDFVPQHPGVPGATIPEHITTGIFSIAGDSSIWFGTDQARVYYSSNRGKSWGVSETGLFPDNLATYEGWVWPAFQDEQTGLVSSFENNRVAITHDGGKNWEIHSTELPFPGRVSYVPGTNNVYMLGSTEHQNGYSLDGGETWEIIDDLPLLSGVFHDNNNGWTTGISTNLLYKWNGSDIVSSLDDDISFRTPEEFSLQQNYPNPFNPETTIAYKISKNYHVDLFVYNILGERVATLISTAQSAGNHSVTFDASNLSTGVYFYMLSIDGEIVHTKKMTLLK